MAGRAVMIVSAILVSLMVVRGLSIFEFSQYVTLMGLLLVANMISDVGISRIQPRFLPELYIQKDYKGLIFLSRALIFLRVAVHTTLLVIFLWSAPLWGSDTVLQMLDKAAIAFLLFAFFYALNQQTQKTMQVLLLQKVAAKIIAIEWLIKLLGLAYLYDGPDSFVLLDVVWLQAIAVSVSFVVGQWVLWKKSERLLKNNETTPTVSVQFKKIYHFAWKNWLQSLLAVPISPGMVRMLVASVAGSVSVAYLGFAYTMMQLLQRILPSKMIVQAIEPVYIARYRESGDFSELNGMVSLVLKLNYFILIPVGVWFAFGSQAVLGWISAGKYADSGWMVSTLIFLFMFENHRMALQVLCNAVDQSMLLVKSNTLALLLLPFYVMGAVYWGLYGLFAGLVLISWFRNVYLVSHLRKQGFNYQQDWKNLMKMFVLAGLSALCVYFLLFPTTGLVISLLSALLCVFVFYGVGLNVKFFKVSERNLINKTVGRKVFRW